MVVTLVVPQRARARRLLAAKQIVLLTPIRRCLNPFIKFGKLLNKRVADARSGRGASREFKCGAHREFFNSIESLCWGTRGEREHRIQG